MKRFILVLLALVVVCDLVFAQKDTVSVLGYYETQGTYGTLNDAIVAARNGGTLNNTVFRLTPFEVYVLSGSIFIDYGESLDIWAPKPGNVQGSAPPQIVWTEAQIDRSYMVQSYGDVRMQNVWLRYADILGNKISSSVTFENQDSGSDPEIGYFDGVLFDYAGIGAEAGGSVTVKADHFQGTFLNSYFRNNSDNHFRYYGRAVSFPYQSAGWHYDFLLFENTTFANIARIVMMEGNEFGDNIHLNHVTVLNSVEQVIQSPGWIKNLSITNSIFVNPYMIGYRAVDVCDQSQDYDDFLNGLCDPPGGGLFDIIPVDSFGFAVDFTDFDRKIYVGYNDYFYYPWFLDWMQNCDNICLDRIASREQNLLSHPYPPFGEDNIAFMDSANASGEKVFTTMNIDSTTMRYLDPEFIEPATNQAALLDFIENKWDDNSDIDWSYMPQAGFNQLWPLPENMAYSNADLQIAGMGGLPAEGPLQRAGMAGFPLGDLNWYPGQLDAWAGQRDQEWAQINDWLNNGVLLPVELVTFNAITSEEGVILSWKTASESNNAGFEVQRSVQSDTFEELAFVEGHGTTTVANTYRHIDSTIEANIYYRYRIKQIDLDGTTSFSKIVEVFTENPAQVSISAIYPNPSSIGPVSLRINVANNTVATVELYDIRGALVDSKSSRLTAGRNSLNLRTDNLVAGLHLAKISVGGHVAYRRFVVID